VAKAVSLPGGNCAEAAESPGVGRGRDSCRTSSSSPLYIRGSNKAWVRRTRNVLALCPRIGKRLCVRTDTALTRMRTTHRIAPAADQARFPDAIVNGAHNDVVEDQHRNRESTASHTANASVSRVIWAAADSVDTGLSVIRLSGTSVR
jgi:hypothetical protein